MRFTDWGAVWKLEGKTSIAAVGHHAYVGGRWDEIGRLQFDFLVGRGLQPDHVLLDIACGSLRGGVQFIPYLDRGHYLGLEREQALVDKGLSRELGADLQDEKAPEFVICTQQMAVEVYR